MLAAYQSRVKLRSVVLAATLLGFTTACSRTAKSTDAATRQDSAGIQIVRTASKANLGSLSWEVDTTASLSIGSEADSMTAWGRVVMGTRLRSGAIVVVPIPITPPQGGPSVMGGVIGERAATVQPPRIFDKDGRFIAQAGRLGRGPGEFASVDFLSVFAGDSIAVFDRDRKAFSVFAPTGSFVRIVSLEQLSFYDRPVGSLSDGSLVFGAQSKESQQNQPVVSNYFVVGLDGHIRDTIARNLIDYRPQPKPYLWNTGGRATTGDDKLFYTEGARYEIEAFDTKGAHQSLRIGIEPRAPRQEEISGYVQQVYEQGLERNQKSAETMRDYYSKLPAPEKLPSFADFRADKLGYLWVLEFRPVDAAPQKWFVFDRSGGCIGTVQMPASWRVLEIGSDYVLAAVHGKDQIERVEVHRLKRSS
jgi:hypothetical protein